MKKLLVVVCIILAAINSNIAQTVSEGPQAGNIGLTVNISPLLGNLFSGNNPTVVIPYGISGKYYISSTRGVRVNLGFGYGSSTTTSYTRDNNGNLTDTEGQIITIKGGNSFSFGLGYEFRRSVSKIQLSFGPQINYNFTSGTSVITDYKSPAASNGDVLETNDGNRNSIGIGGFLGIEYFIYSNISIGTEFGISGSYTSRGRGITKTQGQSDIKSGFDTSNSSLGTNSAGSILLSVYF